MLKIFRILPLIACVALLAGCAQTMRQHSNMVNAINGELTQIHYNKTYIFSTFGYPDSKSVSTEGSVRTEVWTYRTNMKDSSTLLRTRPGKARSMKITLKNNVVTDIAFER